MSENLLMELERCQEHLRIAREALEQIAEGTGRYNRDPLIHAGNVIEESIYTAKKALAAIGIKEAA